MGKRQEPQLPARPPVLSAPRDTPHRAHTFPSAPAAPLLAGPVTRSRGRTVAVPGQGLGLLLHCLPPPFPLPGGRGGRGGAGAWGFALLPGVSPQLVRSWLFGHPAGQGLGVGAVRVLGSRHQQWVEPAPQGQVRPAPLPPLRPPQHPEVHSQPQAHARGRTPAETPCGPPPGVTGHHTPPLPVRHGPCTLQICCLTSSHIRLWETMLFSLYTFE